MANDYEVVAELGSTYVRATAGGIMVVQDDGARVDAVLLHYDEAVFVRDQIDIAIQSGHVLTKEQIAALIKEPVSR